MSGIYIITNLVNGKSYIGKSESSVVERMSQHRRNYRSSVILQRAISKYGINNFRFSIIEKCPPDKCSEREIYWIDVYGIKNLYNIAKGGHGGDTISNLPEDKYNDYIEKLSKPRPENFKVAQSIRFKGENNPMYGKKHSEDTRNKLSESRKGHKNHCYGKRLVNNGIINMFVSREDIDNYLKSGWVLGKIKQ